ncbi:MAG: hypothetical protein QM703_24255 [Gemmatales bacterium]
MSALLKTLFCSFLALAVCSSASAQGVNLTGKWEGNGGSITTFEHRGNVLVGKSWGGPNNSTLVGSMRLTLSANRPIMFKGTYEGSKGGLTGNGTIQITVHDNNKLFVRYNGIVTDGKRTDTVNDSGFAVRK